MQFNTAIKGLCNFNTNFLVYGTKEIYLNRVSFNVCLLFLEWSGIADWRGTDWMWIHWKVLGTWTFQPAGVSRHCCLQQENVDWRFLLQRRTQAKRGEHFTFTCTYSSIFRISWKINIDVNKEHLFTTPSPSPPLPFYQNGTKERIPGSIILNKYSKTIMYSVFFWGTESWWKSCSLSIIN